MADADLAHLSGLVNLELLLLAGTPVTDDGLRHLASLQKLKVLDLGKTRIKGPSPSRDASFPRQPERTTRMNRAPTRVRTLLPQHALLAVALGTCLITAGGTRGDTPTPPAKLLLVGQGPDGHPPQSHEYLAGLKILEKCLHGVPGLEIMTVRADEPWREGPELIGRADGVVLFLAEGARWMNHDPKRREALARMAARKGGIVVLHWAMGTKDARHIDGCLRLLGGCHGGPDRKYKVLETEAILADPKHPVAAGIERFRVRDEFYYRLKFVKPEETISPILRVVIDGREETVAWAWERPDGGRSFGFSGLHFHDNWRLRPYRRLVAQGVLWTLRRPIPAEGLPVQVTDEDLKLPAPARR
jgi:hypothetical protein